MKINFNNQTDILRILFLTGAVTLPIAGYVINQSYPQFYDPPVFRGIFALGSVIVLSLSFYSFTVKKYLDKIFYWFLAFYIPYLTYLVHINQLAPVYILLLFVSVLGMSIGFFKPRPFRIYSIIVLITVLISVYLIPTPAISLNLFTLLFITLMVLNQIIVESIILSQRKVNISNNDFRALIDSIEESIILISKNYRIIKLNKNSGQKVKELYNKDIRENDSILDYVPSYELKSFKKLFKRALNGDYVTREHKLYTLNKEYQWYELKYSPVFDQVGKVTGILFSGMNITAKKEWEKTIIESENRFKRIFEEAPIGIAIVDFNCRFKQLNRTFLETVGYEENELKGLSLDILLHADDRKECFLALNSLTEFESDQIQLEKSLIRKDGNETRVLSKMTRFLDKSKHPEILVQIMDIEQLKQSEDLLRKKNVELEKANEELDKFVYSAAHDLRAPLTSIMGLINVAKIDNSQPAPYYFELIEKSILKLDAFIKDVISFSKNARLGILPEQVDIEEMLSRIFDNHNYIEGADSITKSIQISPDAPLVSDKNRLEIILNNLISNAIKYHDTNKPESFIKIRVTINNHAAHFTIEDNGQGILRGELDKIFNIFYRGNTASTGSGLGLYIVKETVEKLKGVIDVKSKFGRGTTFNIKIPNLKEEAVIV